MHDIVERAFVRGKRIAKQSAYDAKLLLECCVEIGRLRLALQARDAEIARLKEADRG